MWISRLFRLAVVATVLGTLAVAVAGAAIWFHLVPQLPSIESLKDVHFQVPLRVYSADGLLISEFGEKRRSPLELDEVPERMVQAILATEDEHFYEHPGVDWRGLARAVLYIVKTGKKGPGGSTITMQVARNFFLGREKTYVRKLNEILLALKIERGLTKGEILELYVNKIFLGHRAYGVGAAAHVYYGKAIGELTLAQLAMIAGLPQRPSDYNPIANPERAIMRRNYVLSRMHDVGFIDAETLAAARDAPLTARVHSLVVELEAPYVAEMVRSHVEQSVGDAAYTGGYRVYTTVDSRLQNAANAAIRKALIEYDRRHGYRGPELRMTLGDDPSRRDDLLADIPTVGGLAPALVVAVGEKDAVLYMTDHGEVALPWEGMSWARRRIDENRRGPKPKGAADILAPGDVVRLQLTEEGWRLVQVPEVEGALVALDPDNGAIRSLGGGFDFFRSKFNRAIQALRQPGSSFKPFIYSAALEKGYTAASLINDAPVVFDDPGLEAAWRPENYSGKFFGPTRLRWALTKSRNLVSIRLLQAIGIPFALEHIARFGLDTSRLPEDLSLALGSGSVTPLELARGYSVLANGGFLVEPYFVERIVGPDDAVLFRAEPATVCRECEKADPVAVAGPAPEATDPGGEAATDAVAAPPAGTDPSRPARTAPRVISAQNAWLITSLMRDVIQRGTGRGARKLGRKDLAGKTGTTNDLKDAWFSAFTPHLVATAWVGFDDHVEALGRRETGGRAALPMWLAYMEEALRDAPETDWERPDGLVTVRIDPETSRLAAANDPDAIFETFRKEYAPRPISGKLPPGAPEGGVRAEARAEGPRPTAEAVGATKNLF